MITYGHEEYIAMAIEGVLIQHCDFNVELIIGDDCSPDNTEQIVKSYIFNHPHGSWIKYKRHDNNIGMHANAMWAFEQCTGDYVAICEGDDFWTDPLKLSKQVRFLETHTDFSGCCHQSLVIKNGIQSGLFCLNTPSIIGLDDLLGKRIFHTASVVFRSSVVSLILKAPKVLSGDRLTNFLILFSGKLKYFEDIMCVYRLNFGGLATTTTIKDQKSDLLAIAYLKSINPDFPSHKYKSYVYATIGLNKNGSYWARLYYLCLYFVFSFVDFPKNLKQIFNFIRKKPS